MSKLVDYQFIPTLIQLIIHYLIITRNRVNCLKIQKSFKMYVNFMICSHYLSYNLKKKQN